MSEPQDSDPLTDSVSTPPTNVRWLVLALACGTSFFLYLHRYTWNFIAPELQNTYHWTPNEIQNAYVCFSWTYGFGQIPCGVLIDRLGPRRFLAAIVALWSLVIPLQASGSRLLVPLARLGLGATQAGCYPGLAQVTARWFPLRYRTIVQSLVATVCGRGGGAIAPILMATVLMAWLRFDLQTTLWLMTGLGVMFALLFWTFFRDSPRQDPRVNAAERALIFGDSIPEGIKGKAAVTSDRAVTENVPDDSPASQRPLGVLGSIRSAVSRYSPLGMALRLRSVWIIAIMQAFVAGVDTIYSSLLGLYFLSRGVTLGKAGLLASVPLFGGMIGGLCAATLTDWMLRVLPSRRAARVSVGVAGNLLACGAMLVMVRQSDATAAAFALGAVKLFADMSQPIGWGSCTDIGGTKGSATVFAIMNTGGNIGGVLFPLLFGVVLEKTPRVELADGVQQQNFVPLLTVAAAVYVAAGICWLFIDSTKTLDDVERELRTTAP